MVFKTIGRKCVYTLTLLSYLWMILTPTLLQLALPSQAHASPYKRLSDEDRKRFRALQSEEKKIFLNAAHLYPTATLDDTAALEQGRKVYVLQKSYRGCSDETARAIRKKRVTTAIVQARQGDMTLLEKEYAYRTARMAGKSPIQIAQECPNLRTYIKENVAKSKGIHYGFPLIPHEQVIQQPQLFAQLPVQHSAMPSLFLSQAQVSGSSGIDYVYKLVMTPTTAYGGGVTLSVQNTAYPQDPLTHFIPRSPINAQGNGPTESSLIHRLDDGFGFVYTLTPHLSVTGSWDGHIRLDGHKNRTYLRHLCLNIETPGQVTISNVIMKQLAAQSQQVTFQGTTNVLEQIVFRTPLWEIEQNYFTVLSPVTSLQDMTIQAMYLGVHKPIHSHGNLTINNRFLSNKKQTITAKGALKTTSLTVRNGGLLAGSSTQINTDTIFDNESGQIGYTSGPTDLYFQNTSLALGKVAGSLITLYPKSQQDFRVQKSSFTATKGVQIHGQAHPTFDKDVIIQAPFLRGYLMKAKHPLSLGVQDSLKRTIINYSAETFPSTFRTTQPNSSFQSQGSLEFWHDEYLSSNAVEAAMVQRFGEDGRKSPGATRVLTIPRNSQIQAIGGFKVYDPCLFLKLGKVTIDSHKGPFTLMVSRFTANENSSIIAKSGYIHAPRGIHTGQLVRDTSRRVLPVFPAATIKHARTTVTGTGPNTNTQPSVCTFLGGPRYYEATTINHCTFEGSYSLLGRTQEPQGQQAAPHSQKHCFAMEAARTDGTLLQFQKDFMVKGPWDHEGTVHASTLLLDSPSQPSTVTSGVINLRNDLYLTPRTLLNLDVCRGTFNYGYRLDFKDGTWAFFTYTLQTQNPFTRCSEGKKSPLTPLSMRFGWMQTNAELTYYKSDLIPWGQHKKPIGQTIRSKNYPRGFFRFEIQKSCHNTYVAGDPARLQIAGAILGEGTIRATGAHIYASRRDPSVTYHNSVVKTALPQVTVGIQDAPFKSYLNNNNTIVFGGYTCLTIFPNKVDWYHTLTADSLHDLGTPQQVFASTYKTDTIEIGTQKEMSIAGTYVSPALIVLMDPRAEGLVMGTSGMAPRKWQTPLQTLQGATFDMRTVQMPDNIRHLFETAPLQKIFYNITPRYWNDEAKTKAFETAVAPYVKIHNLKTGLYSPTGQTLYSLSPPLLLKWAHEKLIDLTGQGTLKAGESFSYEQLVDLHKNFTDYLADLKQTHRGSYDNLVNPQHKSQSLATRTAFQAQRMPKKPVLWYQEAMNEQGVLEAEPQLFIPNALHYHTGVNAENLLIVPYDFTPDAWQHILQQTANTSALLQGKKPTALTEPSQELSLPLSDRFQTMDHLSSLITSYRAKHALANAPKKASSKSPSVTIQGDYHTGSALIINHGPVTSQCDFQAEDLFMASLADDVTIASQVHRLYRNQTDFADHVQKTRLSVRGLLKIFAGQNINLNSIETYSALQTHMLALAHIVDTPVETMTKVVKRLQGGWHGWDRYETLKSHGSWHHSKGAFTQDSGGGQLAQGVTYVADSLTFSGIEQLAHIAATDTTLWEYYGTKSGFWSDKVKQGREETSKTVPCSHTATQSNGIAFTTHNNSVHLQAAQFQTPGSTAVNAPKGKVVFEAGQNTASAFHMYQSEGIAWNVSDLKERFDLTYTFPSSNGPVSINARQIVMDTLAGAKPSQLMLCTPEDQGDLSLETYLVKNALKEIHEYRHEHHESLGGPLAALISLTVGALTLNSATPWLISCMPSSFCGSVATTLGTTAGAVSTTVGTSCAVGLSSLASVSAVSLISNQGDIGKVFKDVTSSSTLKSLAFDMLSAGLLQGLSLKYDIPLSSSATLGKSMGIGERIQAALLRASVSTGMGVIKGQSLEDSLTSGLQSATASFIGSIAAEKVGAWYKDGKPISLDEPASKALDLSIDYTIHKIAHGAIGAATAALTKSDVLAGAMGAVVGEIIGEAYETAHHEDLMAGLPTGDPVFDQENQKAYEHRQDLIQNGALLAQLGAGIAAAVSKRDVATATQTAHTAVIEDAFVVPPLALTPEKVVCDPQDTDTTRTDSSRERTQEERLHDIFNSSPDDTDQRAVPQTQPSEKDFLGKALPVLAETLNEIFEGLHAIADLIGEGLQDLQKSLNQVTVDIYKGLRESGASVKIAWNEALESTKYALKTGLGNLLKTEPRLQSVVLPAVAVAAAGPAFEALGLALASLTALSYQDLLQQSQQRSSAPTSSRTFSEKSQDTPEGFPVYDGPQGCLETFPALSEEREDLPPYEPHPDDFAETRAKGKGQGGFPAHADANKPKILATPVVDTDPKGNIFTNRAPEFQSGEVTESQFLDYAEKWLGENYKSLPNGRYVSHDGQRQVRYGKHETVNENNHHAHFEAYDLDTGKVIENTVIKITKD